MKKLLSFLKYGLLLGLSALLMWYALKELDFARMWAELLNADYNWVAVSLLMGVAAYVSRAIRWKMQIKPTGYNPSLLHTYNAMMIGYVANLVLPRMGEVARCSILKRTDGLPVNTGFGTVIAERLIDTMMLLLVIALTFLLQFGRIREFFLDMFTDKYNNLEHSLQSFYWVFWVMLGSLVVVLALALRYLNRLRQNNLFKKAAGFVRGMLQGVFSITRIDNQLAFWGHTIFVWVMYYTMSLVVLYAVPATANLGWGAALSILLVGTLGMAAPVQGGVGVYHLLVQATLLLYGVNKEAGMAYALLAHTSQTLLVVVMGTISFVSSMLQRKHVDVPSAEINIPVQNEINR